MNVDEGTKFLVSSNVIFSIGQGGAKNSCTFKLLECFDHFKICLLSSTCTFPVTPFEQFLKIFLKIKSGPFSSTRIQLLFKVFLRYRRISGRKKKKVPGNSKQNSGGYRRFVEKYRRLTYFRIYFRYVDFTFVQK